MHETDIVRACGADEQAIAEVTEDWKRRQFRFAQRAILKRKKDETWCPRKRFRKAAYLYAITTEHQLCEVSQGLSLKHFEQPNDPKLRGHWATWPLGSVSPDLGSEENAAHQNWVNYQNYNIDIMPDDCHGKWDCTKLSLSMSRMDITMKSAFVCFNVV